MNAINCLRTVGVFFFGCTVLVAIAQMKPPPASAPADGDSSGIISIEMSKCDQTRVKRDQSILKLLLTSERARETMATKGRLTVDDEAFDIFLPPKGDGYTVKNTGKDESHTYNISTLIAIDADHDGSLARDEDWFASLPLRVADRMFEVLSIAPDGSRIALRPSKASLAGAVVGRKCPPFSLKTDGGETVTLESFAGKAFLLDIWSVT